MPDATSCSRLAQTAQPRVVVGCRLHASLGLEFFAEVFARTGQTRFNKGDADIGVNGTKRIVGDVNLSEGRGAKERGLPDVWFADQTDAHASTPLRIHSSS